MLGAVDEALEHVRPVSYASDCTLGDRQVILDDVELGEFDAAREVGLFRIRDPDVVPVDRENLSRLFPGHGSICS